MTKDNRRTPEELKAWMRRCANRSRDTADEMAAWHPGCDDPIHPWLPDGEQPFLNWVDFIEQVARPLVDADDHDETVQAAMALYRKASPYFICVSLVMALNKVEELEAQVEALEGAYTGFSRGEPPVVPDQPMSSSL